MTFELTLDGRMDRMTVEDYLERTAQAPAKLELLYGHLGGTREELSALLQLVLEEVGIRHAVTLGDPRLWEQAMRERRENGATRSVRT